MRLPDISRKKVKLRVQYLSLIGHMARIDGKFDQEEKALLKKMVAEFKLSEKHTDKIFAEQLFDDQKINTIFVDLKNNKLHHSFILDLIAMALADGVILEEERMMLTQVAGLIGLDHEEFHKLINFAQAASSLSDDVPIDSMFQYSIEMFFKWARQKDVKLYKQTTFALNVKVDSYLKKDL